MQTFKVEWIEECIVLHMTDEAEWHTLMIEVAADAEVDNYFYQENYGFDVNTFEVQAFKLHMGIWTYFLEQTNDDWCFVYDKDAKLNVDFETIQHVLTTVPIDTELFFPYDKLADMGAPDATKICTSKTGYFWGSYIYLIKRSGIHKLLQAGVITKPLDETLLEYSLSDSISTTFCKTTWFSYNEKMSRSYIERSQDIRNAVYNYPGWTPEQKDKAKEILRILVRHAEKLDIKLLLHAGSLLGAVRHGGIMAWDDDLDLSMNNDDIKKLINSVQAEGILKVSKRRYRKTHITYYKFWPEDGEKVEGYEYAFPFIDIWLVFDKSQTEIRMTDGYIFNKSDYWPPKPSLFEGSKVYMPNKPRTVLDAMYEGWDKEIRIYPWCHRLKDFLFKPLILEINVDSNGRLTDLNI